jgi:hypothetical protein
MAVARVVLAAAMSLLTVPTLNGQECPRFLGVWLEGPVEAVAVSGSWAVFGNGLVLRVADLSDPSAPTVVGEVTLAGVAEGIAVAGSHAFVAAGELGLRVVDFADPVHPVEVGSVATAGVALRVDVSGGHAYVADSEGGVAIFAGCSEPAVPRRLRGRLVGGVP